MNADGPRIVRELYRGLDGWLIPAAETRRIRIARSTDTYGEIMPSATDRLLDYLAPGPGDVLYDLGCGAGKLIVHAAVTRAMRRAVGVELAPTRCRLARRAVRRARTRGLLCTSRCQVRCEDFMDARLDDATIVYTCSTAFPSPLMRRLARKLAALPHPHRLVSLQDLDPHPAFELVHVLRLDMSWRRRAKVHVYRVTPPGVADHSGSASPQRRW